MICRSLRNHKCRVALRCELSCVFAETVPGRIPFHKNDFEGWSERNTIGMHPFVVAYDVRIALLGLYNIYMMMASESLYNSTTVDIFKANIYLYDL